MWDHQAKQAILSAASGNPARLQRLLFDNPDAQLNVRNEDRNTPLHIACLNKAPGVLDILLQRPDVDVNARNGRGETALIIAVMRGFTYGTWRLLRVPKVEANIADNEGHTAAWAAVKDEDLASLKLLVASEKDLDIQGQATITHYDYGGKEGSDEEEEGSGEEEEEGSDEEEEGSSEEEGSDEREEVWVELERGPSHPHYSPLQLAIYERYTNVAKFLEEFIDDPTFTRLRLGAEDMDPVRVPTSHFYATNLLLLDTEVGKKRRMPEEFNEIFPRILQGSGHKLAKTAEMAKALGKEKPVLSLETLIALCEEKRSIRKLPEPRPVSVDEGTSKPKATYSHPLGDDLGTQFFNSLYYFVVTIPGRLQPLHMAVSTRRDTSESHLLLLFAPPKMVFYNWVLLVAGHLDSKGRVELGRYKKNRDEAEKQQQSTNNRNGNLPISQAHPLYTYKDTVKTLQMLAAALGMTKTFLNDESSIGPYATPAAFLLWSRRKESLFERVGYRPENEDGVKLVAQIKQAARGDKPKAKGMLVAPGLSNADVDDVDLAFEVLTREYAERFHSIVWVRATAPDDIEKWKKTYFGAPRNPQKKDVAQPE